LSDVQDLPADVKEWKAKLHRAAQLANGSTAPHLKRAVQILTRSGIARLTRKNIKILQAKNETKSSDIPECPVDAPLIIINPDDLGKLIYKSCTGRKGGPSGWTAELLRTLWSDEACKKGITLLVQLICNDLLDPQSRFLLTTSLLHGIPKGNDDLRPLAIGEEMLRLAAKYCFNLDCHHFPEIFEPIQLAIGSAGGSERALQTMQAAIEHGAQHGHIAIHIDGINAYNEADRGRMLAEVYADNRLANTWKMFSFTYGRPSTLLLCEHGAVHHTIMSRNGGKQGDVLAGLGYARLFQRIYEQAISDLPNVTARAIVDDFTLVGPPLEVFTAYDRFKAAAALAGVRINTAKTVVQQPAARPSDQTRFMTAARDLRLVLGNFKYLGGVIGLDDSTMSSWLSEKLLSQAPLKRAIADPDCPPIFALHLTKVCLLPVPMYLMRSMPYRNFAAPISALEDQHEATLLARHGIPTPLPPQAKISLSQPGRSGGMGVRSARTVAPAAKFAAAAAAACDVQHFVDVDMPLPFVIDRTTCYEILAANGVAVHDPRLVLVDGDAKEDKRKPKFFDLPPDPSMIHTHYKGMSRLKELQRSFTCQLETCALSAFLNSANCGLVDTIRLTSCKSSRGRWIWSSYAYMLTDKQANIVIRLWLGLDPLPNLHLVSCPLCHRDMKMDQWHAFSCVKIRRKAVTTRHDSAAQLLARYARSNGALARIEPKDEASLVPDGEIILPTTTDLFDVSGTHPAAQSYRVNNARHPGAAIVARARSKNNKYLAYASNLGARFVPFVIDTYGWLGKDALRLVKDIENDAFHPRLGLPACTRITSSNFLELLAVDWQKHNANIIFQWNAMIRSARLRTASISTALIVV
jgi:hypothetical protein